MSSYTKETMLNALEHFKDANAEFILRALFSEDESIICIAAKICGLKRIYSSIPRLKQLSVNESYDSELKDQAAWSLAQMEEKDISVDSRESLHLELKSITMNNRRFTSSTINQLMQFIKDMTVSIDPAHGAWHAKRVWETALWLSDAMDVDLIVVQLASLLHDTCDWKYPEAEKKQMVVRNYLTAFPISELQINHIMDIIGNMSYKKNKGVLYTKSLEGQIVQDADRLEAIGATGVIRAMMYSGSKGNAITAFRGNHLEDLMNCRNDSITMHHFYEKLLLLKEGMNTEKAKIEALRRHEFMLQFIDEFYGEIERTEETRD